MKTAKQQSTTILNTTYFIRGGKWRDHDSHIALTYHQATLSVCLGHTVNHRLLLPLASVSCLALFILSLLSFMLVCWTASLNIKTSDVPEKLQTIPSWRTSRTSHGSATITSVTTPSCFLQIQTKTRQTNIVVLCQKCSHFYFRLLKQFSRRLVVVVRGGKEG